MGRAGTMSAEGSRTFEARHHRRPPRASGSRSRSGLRYQGGWPGLETELRRQVSSAGLGQRLARTWRDKHYDNRGLDPTDAAAVAVCR